MADIWREITNGTFKGFVFHVATPTKNLDTHGQSSETIRTQRRIQRIRRPFQNGQRTRDMGANGEDASVELIFFGLGYKRRWEDFKVILDEGTSGTLVLPDREAINATLDFYDESASVDNGNSKTVRVAWTEDEVSPDQIAVGAAFGFIPKGLVNAVNSFGKAVEEVQSVINKNPIIATIRQLENITSTAVNSVVLATSLPKAIRDRVLNSVANIEASLATAVSAFNTLLGLFDTTEPGSGFIPGETDSETGQPIEDGLEDETVIEAVDPLERPERPPTETVEVISLETSDGLTDFEDQMITLLRASVETMQIDTVGRTEDVAETVEVTINDLRDVIAAAKPVEAVQVVTPFELSLPEVMFANGVDLSTIDDVLLKNTFLDDANIIPGNTVITL